jgi:hypothetical protein
VLITKGVIMIEKPVFITEEPFFLETGEMPEIIDLISGFSTFKSLQDYIIGSSLGRGSMPALTDPKMFTNWESAVADVKERILMLFPVDVEYEDEIDELLMQLEMLRPEDVMLD